MRLESVFDSKPDFVNELGTKWRLDAHSTNYANRPDSKGTTLDARVFYVEEISGRRVRVVVESGDIIAEDQTLEGIGMKIDMLKFLKRAE